MQDDSVETSSALPQPGKMSLKNLLVTTVGTRLELATSFNSKVIGVAIKIAGPYFPPVMVQAVRSGTIQLQVILLQTYYMTELPDWVKAFNSRKLVDSLYQSDWGYYLPKEAYAKTGLPDNLPFEYKPFGADQ